MFDTVKTAIEASKTGKCPHECFANFHKEKCEKVYDEPFEIAPGNFMERRFGEIFCNFFQADLDDVFLNREFIKEKARVILKEELIKK